MHRPRTEDRRAGRIDAAGPPVRRRASLSAALALALALALAGLVACDGGRPPPQPHVVVVVLDALHAGHVSHLGYERQTTPSLDALAADGRSFTQAFAPAPYTLASIPSLLTGRLPDRHGVTTKADRLRYEEVTLAELLRDAGYRTLAAVSSANGGARTGIDQGFQEFVELFRAGDGRSTDIQRGREALHIPRADELPPVVSGWLDEVPPGEPLFLYLHILQPHSPYLAPEPFRGRWLDADYQGPFLGGENKPLLEVGRGERDAGADDREAVRALYDANLAWADHHVGRVLDRLRDEGLYDDAWIIVTSDHGEALWQHGLWGHNRQLYDEMLHVPLVVKPPVGWGDDEGTLDELASLTDVLPTLCDLLRLEPPADLDGISLAGPLAGGALPGGRELRLRSHHAVPHVGLRTDDHKLIVSRETAGAPPSRVELYDLEQDPDERDDLAGRSGGRWDGSAARLIEWIESRAGAGADAAPPLTDDETLLLEALGYTGDDG